MGRNKFSQREIDIIRKLLNRKVASNRGGQKMVRHTLRTVFNFNISDFNVQGQPFGPKELDECVRRNRIHILDEATIEEMKQRYAEKKQYEESLKQAEAIANGEVEDWQKVLRQWNEYHSKYNTCKRQEKTIFWISLIFIFAPERRIPKIQKRVGNVKK